jgi:hypothetical protein
MSERGGLVIRRILVERLPACFRPKGKIKLPLDRTAHMMVLQRHQIAC